MWPFAHPSGGMYERPMEEGGGSTSTYPFETWRYRYLEGLSGSQKQEVEIEFVDTCMCNDYHMTMDRSEKDALLNVPGAGLTMVSWSLVACDVQGLPVRYYIKEGSNAGYVGVQIRNARYPIATVAAVGSKSATLALQSYNYWESTAAGAGPLTLRLTDINGQSFQDSGIKVEPKVETTGQGQFPLCR